MSSVLEKLRNANKSSQAPKKDYGPRYKDMYVKWRDGEFPYRFSGTPFTVHGHFLAGFQSPNGASKGLCLPEAFERGGISKATCCLNWDVKNESAIKGGNCPCCQIYHTVSQAIKDGGISDEEIKTLKSIQSLFRPSKELAWNAIDRDNPYVIRVNSDKTETRMKGYKLARLSGKVLSDVQGICEQLGMDISDPLTGVDILVKKDKVNGKTAYTVKAALEKLSIKVTPLTDEEKEYKLIDLVENLNRKAPRDLIIKFLRPEFRAYLDLDIADEGSDPVPAEVVADAENLPF